MSHASEDLVGRIVLGRYRVVRAIGRGGMGVIYLARSEGAAGFVKPFVIKQAVADVASRGDSMLAQLAREARIMSNLSHPGIVSVIDFAEEGGAYLLVLDYVQGYNLGQWRKFVQYTGRPFPAELALHIVERVLQALHYAHTLVGPDGAPLDIVHRDVSPGNVLVDVDGHVKLADFGVARMRSDRTEASDGQLIKGKIAYMAPEILAQGQPTPLSDLYACAVMLHELLIGRNEFRADSVPLTAIRVMQHTASDISPLRNDVSPELDAVLRRGLAKASDERFASAREFAEALNRLRARPADEASRALAAMAREDFGDARMSAFLGVDDPTTLERAWREVSSTHDLATTVSLRPLAEASIAIDVDDLSPRALGRIPSVPTVAWPTAGSPSPTASMAPPPPSVSARTGGHTWGIVLGLAGLLAGAAALAVVLRSRGAQDGDRVIVVDSRVGTGASASNPAETESAAVAAQPVEPAVQHATGHDATSSPPGSGLSTASRAGSAEALSRVLSGRQDQIAACFTTNAIDISGAPALSVRFEIDTNGHVLAANVLPPTLAGTPLGKCIEGVARATEFGPQAKPLSFRIPMTARRSP